MLATGIGAASLVAMPDIAGRAQAAVPAAGSAAAPAGFFFLYGVTDQDGHEPQFQAASSAAIRPAALPAPVSVTTGLATAPVLSPDQSLLGLVGVAMAGGAAQVTLTVLSKASGATVRTASLAIPDVPADTGIVVTPAFSPDSSVVTLVIAVTVKVNRRVVSKPDPRTGGTRNVETGTLRSRHLIACLDLRTGSLAGPYDLGDEGTLALSTVVATNTEVFLWTTMDPQVLHLSKGYKRAAPLPAVRIYPYGERQPRLTAPTAGPWPSSEPAVALPSGDAARLVNARTIQVVSARNGDLSEVALAPLSESRAKPAPATMATRPDGTLFLTKAGVGRAAVADPARGFRLASDIRFPAPAKPAGGPQSKAVLSATGDRLYVLGDARAGGLSSYDMATGALVATYTHGAHYNGVYILPSGTILAVSADNPRLSYFSPTLAPLGTADTGISIAAVY